MARTKAPEVVIHGSPWSKSAASGEKLLTVAELFEASADHGRGKKVPMIRMRGQWLEELGFRSGERVVVKVEGPRIILTLMDEE